MGWRGTMRSINASVKRSIREAERLEKAALKQEMADAAADAVDAWEQYLDALVSVHNDSGLVIDWRALRDAAAPDFPMPITARTVKAETALNEFRPGALDFLKGGSEKQRSILERDLQLAREADALEDQAAIKQYQLSLSEWEDDQRTANKVLSGDVEAMRNVIAENQSLAGIDFIGKYINFEIKPNFVHCIPEVHGSEIVPTYRRKLLASGRLSETKMPIGQMNEFYQDYVASVAIRVAAEIFGILPLDEVFVTCNTKMLNPSTGHQEITPILSVHFVRDTFQWLDLSNIDPSDALGNFRHAMNFRKTKGFIRVDPIVELATSSQPPPLPEA